MPRHHFDRPETTSGNTVCQFRLYHHNGGRICNFQFLEPGPCPQNSIFRPEPAVVFAVIDEKPTQGGKSCTRREISLSNLPGSRTLRTLPLFSLYCQPLNVGATELNSQTPCTQPLILKPAPRLDLRNRPPVSNRKHSTYRLHPVAPSVAPNFFPYFISI
jgi:hypothetical protein